MTGVLVGRDGARRITIRDVSKNGALIATTDRLPQGCDVLLSRGSLVAAARVIWVKGTEAGLKFYRELSPDEVKRTLSDVASVEVH